MLSSLKVKFKRVARRVVWPRPLFYAPFGILRNRGNVFGSNHQLYISGFPRSGNTFAVKAFQSANPNTPLRSHKHIPSFVVQSVRCGTPGMVLIRSPIDAAISWAIFKKISLGETLAYYNDYYTVLLPFRDELFLTTFEEVTADFGKVTATFNARWNTDYVQFQHTPENVARCMAEIESEYVDRDGNVNECKVPRPSARRNSLKENFLAQISRSTEWQEELHRANELYRMLAPQHFARSKLMHKTTTTQSIRLRPA